jgi:hypothetical protein
VEDDRLALDPRTVLLEQEPPLLDRLTEVLKSKALRSDA